MSHKKRVTPNAKVGFMRSTPGSGRRPNMNATLLSVGSGSGCRTNLNSTVCTPKMLPSITVLEDDTEMELEFAYNSYLQNLLKKQILTKTIEDHKTKCNDQLELYRTTLEKYSKQEASLKAQLDEKNIIISFKRDMNEMKVELEANEDTLNAQTKKQSESCMQLLAAENNKLYLRNVEPLKDYNKFFKLIDECDQKLDKFKNLIGDTMGIEQLTKCLALNASLQEDIVNKNKTVQSVADGTMTLVLEIVSDMLVNNV